MRIYVDPAALIRRISRDATASRLRQQLHESWWVGDLLATSVISGVELTRFADRFRIPRSTVQDALAGVEFVPLSSEVLASSAEPQFGKLDLVTAIHVSSAMFIEAEGALCYDPRMAAALEAAGIGIRNE